IRQQGIPGLGGIPEAQQGAGGWLRGGHKAAPAPEQDQTVVDHQAGDPFLFKLLKQLLQQLRRDGLPLKVQAGHTGALHMQAAAFEGEARWEENTSEIQSRFELVCRLLLVKLSKKI